MTKTTFIGTGGMARHHLQTILANFPDTDIPVVAEPSDEAFKEAVKIFEDNGRPIPVNQPNLQKLLNDYRSELDAAFIITPHSLHHDHAKQCLEAGLDVLLEKPMVTNATEAQSLIDTVANTDKLLVIAFNGSLSPQIRTAEKLLRSGDLGELLSISATVWQNWDQFTVGSWRQVPKIAGGGFLFDTGAHMLNTVADLAGQDFVEVAAWFDNRGRDIDILGVVIGRLQSGALVTLHGSGDTAKIGSDLKLFCKKGIIYTDVWGKWLELQRLDDDTFKAVPVPESHGVWQQFLAVRNGDIPNPSPPEVGLRMAKLWDAIKQSAQQGGIPVKL